MLNIFITNLGKYNEGELIGEWVSLPCEDFKPVMNRIGINGEYEETFITDYETDINGFEVSEWDNLDKLNEVAMQFDELELWELEQINAMMSYGYSKEEAFDNLDNCMTWFDCESMADVAMQYVEECGLLENVPENIARYFDYEALGRDMDIEGTFIATEEGNIIEVMR